MVPRDSVAIVGIQPEERNSRSKYSSKFFSSKRKECKHRRDKNNESVFDDLGFVSFLFTRGILSPLQFGEGTLAVIINVLITAARGHGSRGGWTAAERLDVDARRDPRTDHLPFPFSLAKNQSFPSLG